MWGSDEIIPYHIEIRAATSLFDDCRMGRGLICGARFCNAQYSARRVADLWRCCSVTHRLKIREEYSPAAHGAALDPQVGYCRRVTPKCNSANREAWLMWVITGHHVSSIDRLVSDGRQHRAYYGISI